MAIISAKRWQYNVTNTMRTCLAPFSVKLWDSKVMALKH